jgi:hypothetical protein
MEEADLPRPEFVTPKQIGPWAIESIIYSDRSKVRILSTTTPNWVIKLFVRDKGGSDELANILMMKRHGVSYTVLTPNDTYHQFGAGPGYTWFAMRKYTGHINSNLPLKMYWRRVATSVLHFLRDLHINCGRVYMDIKTSNILYTHIPTCLPDFVVADYELVDTIDLSRPTRSYSNNTKWYYIAMGAELDEPLYSWRMDLVATGYMLAALTHDYGSRPLWKYYDMCLARRENSLSLDITDDSIITLRSAEIATEDPIILEYLRTVAEFPWNSPVPPSAEFYTRLISIFES